jgi:hypothetical protein
MDRRPTSLAECIDDEGLKAFEFIRYRRCQRSSDESDSLSQFMDSILPPEANAIVIAKPTKRRAKNGSAFDYLDENGQLVHSSPTTTQWYTMYVANDPTKACKSNLRTNQTLIPFGKSKVPFVQYNTGIEF